VSEDREHDFRAWAVTRREPLRRAAFLICGDWFLADDLVQDATARVYARWDKVAERGDPDAYARKVVVNLLIDERRRPWRRREINHDELPEPRRVPAASGDLQSDVLAALARVPPRQRAVLVLRFFEDQSVEDTAAILGCSPGTVKSQTSKGLSHLRAALAELGVDDSPITAREIP
jgi:RNA polymerase sigma-70 factor (sigma-E family)